MGGTKHDQSKPAFHLIDARFDLEVLNGPNNPNPGQHLRQWARQNPNADLRRVFWAVVAKFCTDNPQRTARLELARVLHFGAEKYGANNWKGGFNWSRLWRSAYGHIEAHKAGDIYDEETGFLHLSHALCCLMFLIVHERDGLGEDDRAEIWPLPGSAEPGAEQGPSVRAGRFELLTVEADVATWRSPTGCKVRITKNEADGFSTCGLDWLGRGLSKIDSTNLDYYIDEMREVSWPEVAPASPVDLGVKDEEGPIFIEQGEIRFNLVGSSGGSSSWRNEKTNSVVRVNRFAGHVWTTEKTDAEVDFVAGVAGDMKDLAWPE